jgi:hypothetical protein
MQTREPFSTAYGQIVSMFHLHNSNEKTSSTPKISCIFFLDAFWCDEQMPHELH